MKRAGIALLLVVVGGAAYGEEIPFEVDPGLEDLIPASATLERVAEGFQFVEGPVWRGDQQTGHLLFSDTPANRVYRWAPSSGEVSIEIEPVHDPSIITGARGGSNASRGLVALRLVTPRDRGYVPPLCRPTSRRAMRF